MPGVLRSYVETGLRRKWSPEQISHRMVTDFPADPRRWVCTETIYQAVYAQTGRRLNGRWSRCYAGVVVPAALDGL